MVLLINKNNIFNEELIKDFQFIEYENYEEKTIFVESETFNHFEMLRAHLRVDGIIIDIYSAYRSLEAQEDLFLSYMKTYGLEEAQQLVEMPGFSEHHTGQAIDIAIKYDKEWIYEEDERINSILDKVYRDLKYFGFILRYPKDKEDKTMCKYEPLHIRYIGDLAMEIGNLTLEEYLK